MANDDDPSGGAAHRPRSYGAGSVYRLSDGRWRAALDAGYTRSGGRRRVTRTRATEREARSALASLRREAARSGGTAPARAPTVRSWLAEHSEVVGRTRRSASAASLRWAITHIVPVIGQRRLDAITASDIRAVHEAAFEAGLAVASVARVHGALRTALRAAVKEGHTVSPAALAVEGVGAPPRTRGAIPDDHLAALLQVLERRDDGLRYITQLHTGARAAEVTGLTWDRVDLDAGLITIDRQLVRVARREDGSLEVPRTMQYVPVHGTTILAPLKAESGARVVPVGEDLVRRLRDLLRAQESDPRAGERDAGSPDLIFTRTRARGTAVHITRTYDQKAWRAIQDEAGVRHPSGRYFGTHEIRHTTATRLARSGAPLSTIRAALGHTRVETSLRYQHPDRDDMRSALRDALRDDQGGGSDGA